MQEDNRKKHILALSGSIRKQSSNESILRIVAGLAQDRMEITVYDRLGQLPYFNPDLDTEGHEPPPEVGHFREAVRRADAVIICTPEYVFSLPGVLKNALEWTVSTTIFSFKPVAFIVAASSGEKAFACLDLVMKTLVQLSIPGELKLLIKGPRAKLNREGVFCDEQTLSEVSSLVSSLMLVMEGRQTN